MSTIPTIIVIVLSAYSILKFAVFFVIPYARRRAALDKAYAGRAAATTTSDKVLLVVAAAIAAAVLFDHGEPISFLGGLFVGAILIQLFFHAFHVPVEADREAPEPRSPLKQMSYAIQDKPARAWKEMVAMTVIIGTALILHFLYS